MGKETTTLLIRNIDNDLKTRFQVACTLEHRSMTQQVKVLMQEFVERKEMEQQQYNLFHTR